MCTVFAHINRRVTILLVGVGIIPRREIDLSIFTKGNVTAGVTAGFFNRIFKQNLFGGSINLVVLPLEAGQTLPVTAVFFTCVITYITPGRLGEVWRNTQADQAPFKIPVVAHFDLASVADLARLEVHQFKRTGTLGD